MNRPLSKRISPLLLVLILLFYTSSLRTVNCEREKEQEQVCTEEDQTCRAREVDGAAAVPHGDEDKFDDDDDDDYDDDYDGDEYYNGDFGDGGGGDGIGANKNAVLGDDDDNYDYDDDDYGDDDYGDGDGDGEGEGEVEEPKETCIDNHEKCLEWAQIGECDKNPKYMLPNCRRSCDICKPMNVGFNSVDELEHRMNEQMENLQDELAQLENELKKKTDDLQRILGLLTNSPEIMNKIAAAAAAKKK